jgi:hypothetical protein
MKDCKLYVLFFLFFCSCNFKNNENENVLRFIGTDSPNEIIQEYNLIQRNKIIKSNRIIQIDELDYIVIGDSIVNKRYSRLPKLSYKFNVDGCCFLKSIFVYSDTIKIQKIIVNEEIEPIENQFQLLDWNFDGYEDISVLIDNGNGGWTYLIWNYSPKSGKYYYNKELSERMGLEIDTKSRFIIFHIDAGYEDEWWDTLRYKNNKLTFVKGLYQKGWNDSRGNLWFKRTHTKIINNKPIITIDSSNERKNFRHRRLVTTS